ncbi:MAG: MFS transporter [Chloroflexi bacterium]|nr:MFS transporter [Chloroflexota bacterium]
MSTSVPQSTATSTGSSGSSASSASAQAGRSWRDLYSYWAALIALVLVSVGFGAIAPSLSNILAELAVGASVGSLLVSALGAGRLAGGFPAGMVVGRLGPGRVILLGCSVFVVGSVIGWLAPNFSFLALGRFVQGVGLGIVPAGVLAGIMAGAKAERAGGSMALYQSALTLGGAFGPAVGGPVAELYDWRAALLFCVGAGLLAILIALPLATRRPAPTSKPAAPRERLGLSALLAVMLVLLPHLATFLFRMSVAQLALPLYASGPAGLEPSMVGLLLGSQAVMALVMLGPAGWATNKFGVRPVVAGALCVASVAVGLMPLVPTPYGLWAATVLFGGGLAVLGVGSGLLIFTLEGYSTGALVGIYRLSGDLMQVFGPIVIGAVLDALGFQVSFFTMAACGLLAIAGAYLRPGVRRP